LAGKSGVVPFSLFLFPFCPLFPFPSHLYGVTTGNLNLAVRRNKRRFPQDFVLQLTVEEFESLLLQNAITKGRGGRRTRPYAFTEHGVAMLSSVLRSGRAADVNVAIMRTFTRLRRMLATFRPGCPRIVSRPVRFATMEISMVQIEPLRIDVEREEDGRFLASVPDLPGVMGYGQTPEEATRKVKAIALQVLADMIESGEDVPDALKVLFAA
jgi:predicted RNase H-like HicB family nuclease